MLIQNGVRDYDRAFAMDRDERLAHVIAFGMMAGGKFDWHAKKWVEPDR